MVYRKFGSLDFEVSALGFGCMRFQEKDGKIDREASTTMMDLAMKAGVNYYDTAWPYHNGDSEVFIGEYFKANGKRKEIAIADKLPSWLIKTQEDLDHYFYKQLERLQTDYIDFYLLHSLDQGYWDTLKSVDILSWLEEKKASGQIRYIGFSFHDEYPVFEEIIKAYSWDFCQIQLNYMNINYQAGLKGLELAAANNIAVVIMEPLLGGRLVDPPAKVQKIWDMAETKRSAVEWALAWLWDKPEVATVLSGMTLDKHVRENLEIASKCSIGMLNNEEQHLYTLADGAYKDLILVPCTACGYCEPCPQGVNIPGNFEVYNSGKMYDKLESARGEYSWMKRAAELGISSNDKRAVHCIQCGECVPKCPQKIKIDELMMTVDLVLSGKKTYEEV